MTRARGAAGEESRTKAAAKANADCLKNGKGSPWTACTNEELVQPQHECPAPRTMLSYCRQQGSALPPRKDPPSSAVWLSRQSEGSAVSGESSSSPAHPSSVSRALAPAAVQRARTLIQRPFQGPNESCQEHSGDFGKEQPGALEGSDPAGRLSIPTRNC